MSELRPVVGFEGLYAVTEDGRVWSCRANDWRKHFVTERGYRTVQLWRDGRFRSARVHRLVAEAWLENPRALPCVNHLDGVKGNNSRTNLEWCTQGENNRHAVRVGLNKPPKNFGTGFWSGARKRAVTNVAKLTDEQVAQIKAKLARGKEGRALALEYGVAPSTISEIRTGRHWSDIPAAGKWAA